MLKLTIYANDTYTDIREERTAQRIKIPYRVAQYVINLIPTLDLRDGDSILRHVLSSEDEITKVVRATFGITDEDLEYVDIVELGDVAKEIVNYVVQKLADMGIRLDDLLGNPQTPAATS